MDTRGAAPTRRSLLALGAGAALAAACTPAGGTASAAPAGGSASAAQGSAAPAKDGEEISGQLRDLERTHAARLGVFAHNVATGATVRHRADERFPICSVFKPLAVAAVLRDLDRDGAFLARRIRYTESDLATHSPITGTAEHLAGGMTVEELCDAAIRHSDNTAANLLLRELGGPTAITRFCRSIGDPATRLDRWETELNSAEPWRVEDTTTPRAIAGTYTRLCLRDGLEPQDRKRLTGWLLKNTTSGEQFRKGLPKDWSVADKTGSGKYGTGNDVGIAWTADRSPIVLAVLTTKNDPAAKADYPLIAKTAAALAKALT
ncbi:class A beta-lactamase [Streptomyces sp. NPDC020681]|uniref:class A beta-lactamase n=1 Tax=Streptomyces sp. NPDC020681 TaxID=3365083 RepID=UPI0037B5FE57